jgi:hypothetical protein
MLWLWSERFFTISTTLAATAKVFVIFHVMTVMLTAEIQTTPIPAMRLFIGAYV